MAFIMPFIPMIVFVMLVVALLVALNWPQKYRERRTLAKIREEERARRLQQMGISMVRRSP